MVRGEARVAAWRGAAAHGGLVSKSRLAGWCGLSTAVGGPAACPRAHCPSDGAMDKGLVEAVLVAASGWRKAQEGTCAACHDKRHACQMLQAALRPCLWKRILLGRSRHWSNALPGLFCAFSYWNLRNDTSRELTVDTQLDMDSVPMVVVVAMDSAEVGTDLECGLVAKVDRHPAYGWG